MTQAALKKRIHQAIDDIDDDSILEAVYTILNSRVYSSAFKLSNEDLRIVEERKAAYKSGKTKMLSAKEVNQKIMKKLRK